MDGERTDGDGSDPPAGPPEDHARRGPDDGDGPGHGGRDFAAAAAAAPPPEEPPPATPGGIPGYIHVPASPAGGVVRTQSVSDLAAAAGAANTVPLSDVALRDKGRMSRREQFEERLRRADLRLDHGAAGTAGDDGGEGGTKYRSKSTPLTRRGRQGGGRAVYEHRFADEVGRHAPANAGGGGAADESPGTDRDRRPPDLAAELPAAADGLAAAATSAGGSSSASVAGGSHRSVSDLRAVVEPPRPPPVTEKERLVERERQARLEAERARRRHQAVLRERRLEGDGGDGDGDGGADLLLDSFDAADTEDRTMDAGDAAVDAMLSLDLHEFETRFIVAERGGQELGEADNSVPATEGNFDSSLEPPVAAMLERFLEDGVSNDVVNLPVDDDDVGRDADHESSSALPYTMELFLAESSAVAVGNDEIYPDQEGYEPDEAGMVDVDEVESENDAAIHHAEAIGFQSAHDERTHSLDNGGGHEGQASPSHAGSDGPWEHPDDGAPSGRSPTYASDPFDDGVQLDSDSSDGRDSPRPAPLTEEGILRLEGLDHASTGMQPPQSVRDEPSVPSEAAGGADGGGGLSVAT